MTRKVHNKEDGYIAERKNPWFNYHKVVIYNADEQGIDVAPDKYAVVCDAHATHVGTSSVPKARVLMKAPEEFCEGCDILARTTLWKGETMNELKELLNLWHASREGSNCDEETYANLCDDGFLDRLRKLAESTAYVIPKCPKCRSDEIEACYDPAEDWCLLYCRECRHELVYSKSGKDGPDMYLKEAAKAFGEPSP